MQRDYKRLKFVLSVIIITLLVACAFIACLPHGHECIDSECAVCNMADSVRSILLGAALAVLSRLLLRPILILPSVHGRIIFLGQGTPVGLKVKLSD